VEDNGRTQPRVIIVGAGFAGYQAARRMRRLLHDKAEIVVINSTDYFLYIPLLPEVAAGVLNPRHVAIPLSAGLQGVRLVLGTVQAIDLDANELTIIDADGGQSTMSYDRLLLTPGSVNKLLPIPGVTEHAHGFRSVAEALYLRDHLIREVELADATADEDECTARCTFVVVGAGYTGTEVAGQGQLLTKRSAAERSGLRNRPMRWLLVDLADRVLPELDPRLSRTATRVLSGRGVEIRTNTSGAEATSDGVKLSDGEFVPTRSLIWCVGVRPDSLVGGLDLPTDKGRLCVDEFLGVPGRAGVFACGDAAAVPDLTRPGSITPMTAQHAARQGHVAAHNIAASLGVGAPQPYRHRDLGFVVDLGGTQAAANPIGVPLSGVVAKTVTRGYHLLTVPGNRARIATDWLLNTAQRRQVVQLGLVRSEAVPLDPEHR
jgi:NADH dehydrogenase